MQTYTVRQSVKGSSVRGIHGSARLWMPLRFLLHFFKG